MTKNGKGDNITFETKWTGGIKNPEWYKDPNFAPYVDWRGSKSTFLTKAIQ